MRSFKNLLITSSLYLAASLTFFTLPTSCQYDDTELVNRVDDVEDRLSAVEQAVEQAQTNISNLQTIINAIQSQLSVTSVTEDKEDGSYTITFSNGISITIGGEGQEQPSISVVEDGGDYFWVYVNPDGTKEYIVDDEGNPIQANGPEGIVPLIRVNEETGEWEYSIDEGETWVSTGVVATGADGDSFFDSVDSESSDDYIFITLADGTELKLPKVKDLVFTLENESITDFTYSETREVGVTMSGIYKYSISKPDGWRAELKGQALVVTAPAQANIYAEESGVIAVVAVASNGQSMISELRVAIGATSDVTDLSAVQTANSYIVNAAGSYGFNATVQGNGAAGAVIDGYSFPDYVVSMNPASAKVVWMTSAGLITDVAKNGNNIEFTVPEMVDGNALIAALDSNGEIIWSWHIWVTSADLEASAQTYPATGYVAMDRDLGALSNTPGDANTMGLLYQWGRKDPFVGAKEVFVASPGSENDGNLLRRTLYDANGEEIIPLIDFPSVKSLGDGSIGSIAYATAHPTTFIGAKNGSDWYDGTGVKFTDRNNYLWGNPNGHIRKDVLALHTTEVTAGSKTYLYTDSIPTRVDNKAGEFFSYYYDPEDKSKSYCFETDIVPEFETGQKSIYDPCPAGWRVPHSSLWVGYHSDSDAYYESVPDGYINTSQFDNEKMGRTFDLGNGETAWYQCGGSLSYSDGKFGNYNNARYWGNDSGSADFIMIGYKDLESGLYEGYYYKYIPTSSSTNAAYFYFSTSSVTSKMVYNPTFSNIDDERKPNPMNMVKVGAQDSNGGSARSFGQSIRCVKDVK